MRATSPHIQNVSHTPFERVFGGYDITESNERPVIDSVEADMLVMANEDLGDLDSDWSSHYLDNLVDYALRSTHPHGTIKEGMVSWLKTRVFEQGRVRSHTDLELLVRVIETAQEMPTSLVALIINEIELSVRSGDGVTRPQSGALPGCIGANEQKILTRISHRIVNSWDVQELSREMAWGLCRIKDTLDLTLCDPDFLKIFVKHVSNYLCAFGSRSSLDEHVEAELDDFMTSHLPRVKRFLGFAMSPDQESTVTKNLLGEKPDASEREILELLFGVRDSLENAREFETLWARGIRHYLRPM